MKKMLPPLAALLAAASFALVGTGADDAHAQAASFTLSSEQHGRSGTSSPWQNSFIVAPTTS